MNISVQQIGQFLIICVILGGIWYLFDKSDVPPKAKMVVNVILSVVAIVVGIRFLMSLV